MGKKHFTLQKMLNSDTKLSQDWRNGNSDYDDYDGNRDVNTKSSAWNESQNKATIVE